MSTIHEAMNPCGHDICGFNRDTRRRWLKFCGWTIVLPKLPRLVLRGQEAIRYVLLPGSRRWPAIYIHRLVKSDPRILHDHSWNFWTLILKGAYTEVTPDRTYIRKAGDWFYRPASWRHRLVIDRPCWTLVFCGPRLHHWGFFVPRLHPGATISQNLLSVLGFHSRKS